MKAFPALAAALGEMLDRMDVSLRAGGHAGPPVIMYLAGGVAVNFHCGTRYTEDVDASFSRRFVLPRDLTVSQPRILPSSNERPGNDRGAAQPQPREMPQTF